MHNFTAVSINWARRVRLGGRETPMGAIEARVHYGAPSADSVVAEAVHRLLGERPGSLKVLCIGTDRCTGDALGPLVGTALVDLGCPVPVIGTLEHPVHAGNLRGLLPQLAAGGGRIIAVDASLGQSDQVGSIFVARGPLSPGAGVRKDLAPVGDVAVSATVNVGGFLEYLVLQNTRLFLVAQMARVIARALLQVAAQTTGGPGYTSNVCSRRSTSSSGVMPSTLMTGVSMSRSAESSPRKSSP
jgi:putative sporulation protein YyaC